MGGKDDSWDWQLKRGGAPQQEKLNVQKHAAEGENTKGMNTEEQIESNPKKIDFTYALRKQKNQPHSIEERLSVIFFIAEIL